MPGSGGGNHHAAADEPISELIKRARLALGLSQDLLARRLAEVSSGTCVTREFVARWERGRRIPGPYWRVSLSRVLDLPGGALERAAVIARLRRIVTVSTS
jgi:transcriptional regulator with XRE-family HTH domain